MAEMTPSNGGGSRAAKGDPNAPTDADRAALVKTALVAAMKQIKHIQRQASVSATGDKGIDMARLDHLEKHLADARLHSVVSIMNDFRGAAEEKLDVALWQAHSCVNTAFRKAADAVEKDHVVQARKIQTKWASFLQTSQMFYVTLIQRIGAMFGNDELKAATASLGMNVGDWVDAGISTDLKDMVNKSVYFAIIRMGDLNRYHFENRQRSKFLTQAYSIYSLAHELRPDIGTAHHQMALVSDLQRADHLKLIYHFYMAANGSQTTAMTRQNLVNEFKKVLSKTNAPQMNPMVLWFVKLHANLYLGNFKSASTAGKHAELENEVTNRLEGAVKSADDDTLSTLLTMVIVNIAAYDFAKKSHASVNNDGPGHGAFFKTALLRFTVRFAVAFCRLLTTELDNVGQTFKGDGISTDDSTTLVADRTLPCLRLLFVFLVANHGDVVGPPEHPLFDLFHDLYRGIASTGSSLMMLAGTEIANGRLREAPYMLIEDKMALGVTSLSSPSLPPGCRLGYLEQAETRKPMALVGDTKGLSFYEEAFCRVFDISRCTYFLAAQSDIPIQTQVTRDAKGGQIFHYAYKTSYVPEELAQPQNDEPRKLDAGPATVHIGSSALGGEPLEMPAAAGVASVSGPQPNCSHPAPPAWNMPVQVGSPVKVPTTVSGTPMKTTIPAAPQATAYGWGSTKSPAAPSASYEESLAAQVYRPRTVFDESHPRQQAAPLDEHVKEDLLRRLNQIASPNPNAPVKHHQGDTSAEAFGVGAGATTFTGSGYGAGSGGAFSTAPGQGLLYGGASLLSSEYFNQSQTTTPAKTQMPRTNGSGATASPVDAFGLDMSNIGHASNQGATIVDVFRQALDAGGTRGSTGANITGGIDTSSPFIVPAQPFASPTRNDSGQGSSAWMTDYATRLQRERQLSQTPYPQYQAMPTTAQSPIESILHVATSPTTRRQEPTTTATGSQYVPDFISPDSQSSLQEPPRNCETPGVLKLLRMSDPTDKSCIFKPPMSKLPTGCGVFLPTTPSRKRAQVSTNALEVPQSSSPEHGDGNVRPRARSTFSEWDQDVPFVGAGDPDYVTNDDDQIPAMKTGAAPTLAPPEHSHVSPISHSMERVATGSFPLWHSPLPDEEDPTGEPTMEIPTTTPKKKRTKTPKGSASKNTTTTPTSAGVTTMPPHDLVKYWNLPTPDRQALTSDQEPRQLHNDWQQIDQRLSASRSAYDGIIFARVRESMVPARL